MSNKYTGEKKYNNSPIVEAICEFKVNQSTLGLNTPLKLFNVFKDKFPITKDKMVHTLTLKNKENNLEQVARPDKLTQFLSEDEKTLIQVGTGVFSINKLAPYNGWEEFEPIISDSFNKYKEIVKDCDPKFVILKYINLIYIEEKNFLLEKYFNFFPYTPPNFPGITGFNSKVVIPYKDGKDVMKINIAKSPVLQEGKDEAILLDFEYVSTFQEDLNVTDILKNSHDEIGKMFETCITDKLREDFEVQK